VPATAVIGDNIDANCTNVVIRGESFTPAPTGTPSVFTVRGKQKWDVYNCFNAQNNNDGVDYAGAGYDGTNYVGGRFNTPGTLAKYNLQGDFVNYVNITNLPRVIDMDWDGEYFYSVNAENPGFVSKFTVNPPALIENIPITYSGYEITPIGVAFDPNANEGAGGLWISSFNTDIILLDMTGTEIFRIPQENFSYAALDVLGLALDYWTPGGPFLWLFSQSGEGWAKFVQIENIYADDPALRGLPTGEERLTAVDLNMVETSTGAAGAYFREDPVTNNVFMGGVIQGDEYNNDFDRIFEYFMIRNVPMSYVSSTVVDATEKYVKTGSVDRPILKIEVVTDGITIPIEVTSFTLNTDGTTSTLDLTNASIYYTGNDDDLTLSICRLFCQSSGEFIIEGNQQLLSGTNYFWLTYDIASDAVPFNLVDAECIELVTFQYSESETRIPTVTDPDGYSKIIPPLSVLYGRCWQSTF
jgi:hypothetical protein